MATPRFRKLDVEREEIRLIRIEAAAEMMDDLSISVEHYSLKDAPLYLALSYTWGPPHPGCTSGWDAQDRHPIVMNGEQFHITLNLRSALRHMRESLRTAVSGFQLPIVDPPGEVLIWVDAICINQEDLEERAAQVLRMPRIYSGAVCTIAWLTPQTQYMKPLFKKLQDLDSRHEEQHGNLFSLREPRVASLQLETDDEITSVYEQMRLDFGHDEAETELEAIVSFFMLHWWQRVWMVQEFVLSKDVIFLYGMVYVSLPVIRLAHDMALKYQDPPYLQLLERSDAGALIHSICHHSRRYFDLCQLRNGFRRAQPHLAAMDPIDALCSIRNCDCSDPRDKVFAGISMAPGLADLVQVDYTLPFEQVYKDLARNFMQQSASLSLLAYCEPCEEEQPSRIPSWAPDWRVAMKLRRPLFDIAMSRLRASPTNEDDPPKPRYRAGGQDSLVFKFIQESDSIRISGALVDTIDFVGRCLTANSEEDEERRKIQIESDPLEDKFWIREAHRFANEDYAANDKVGRYGWLHEWLLNRENAPDTLPSTSSTSGERSPCADPQFDDLEYSFTGESIRQAYLRTICVDLVGRHEQDTVRISERRQSLDINSAEFVDWLEGNVTYTAMVFSIGRALIATKTRGLIGLGHEKARSGDCVVIVPGCEVPLILRPEENQDNKYRFIGECYVHGLMDGEWAQQNPDQALETMYII